MANTVAHPAIVINETLAPLPGNPGSPGVAFAVFAANYTQGPLAPTLITSWNQYLQLYGSFAAANGNPLHFAVYQFFNNGGSQCYVLSIPNTDAVQAQLVLQDINTPPDNVITVKANSPGTWGNSIYTAITSSGTPGRFNFQVYNGGTTAAFLIENFVDLSINPVDPRNVFSIVNSATSGSNFVTLTNTLPAVYVPGVNDPAYIGPTILTGGSNGVVAPNLGTSIPVLLDQLQGQQLYLNVPGVPSNSTVNALITWASGRGDTMIVVDGPAPSFPETSAQVVQNYINLVTGGSAITASSYAALYAPWVSILDPSSTVPGAQRWVAPGGAVLGIWNRTDNAVGPYQTPAGIQYGAISAQNLEVQFTPADLDNLNINNINAIRFVPGYFPAIMGGRTLGQTYPTRYLSVRRELIQIEHDFTQLLQFALFLPNDQNLWDQVSSVLNNYLNNITQQGILASLNANSAYSVVCDSSNNTPASAGSGIVNATVAVAITSPAEFIVLNISQLQSTGSVTITTNTATV